MEKINTVFQTDSEIIAETYRTNSNYLIEYSQVENSKDKYCVLYFSSNDLYFPNTKDTFQNQLLDKNKFEWYGTRVENGSKHIFLRDIKKQWYLTGVNQEYNSIEKLSQFLKKETEGYKVITLGSSAGGYAAVLLGSLLNAELIYTFNGQFQISDLLQTSVEAINPIIFREQLNPAINQYFSLRSFIKKPNCIFYFYSDRSKWDINQFEHIADLGVQTISFRTSHHGIPFFKSNLKYVLNKPKESIRNLVYNVQYPLLFSFKIEGMIKSFYSLFKQTQKYLSKKIELKK